MKALLTAITALLSLGATALAQEETTLPETFPRRFSLELAVGLAPIHTLVNINGLRYERTFSDEGREPDLSDCLAPALSLSAVWKTFPRWEMVLTGGASWCHHKVVRYDSFGIDPQGRPRYDLYKPHPDGSMNSALSFSLFFQARYFWNPAKKIQFYSAFGGGFILNGTGFYLADDARLAFVPSLTPIAVRFNAGPLHFFLENAYSPAATLVNGGLGWTF